MGKKINLRDVLALIKDKASLSRAALHSNTSTLRLAVVRATTHSPPAPPNDHLVSTLLTLGDGSRATASSLITALIDRLHRTGNCVVAIKCLLIIHHIIKRGTFILQDQLSIFPTSGGYNYLNLSSFRDTSAATWALSAWVRWYARYLETLLATSRVLGFFLGSSSSSSSVIKENQDQRISSFLNADLIKEIDSLVDLIVEICEVPDSLLLEENMLVKEILGLLLNDHLSAVNEVLLRLGEVKERLSCLSFGDSVELTCQLKRLQDCKEGLSALYVIQKPSVEMMWSLVSELTDEVGRLKVCREGGKLLSQDKMSESARFGSAVSKRGDSVQFQSSRFAVRRFL